ncbi:ribonuclease HII [candidate division WWE3 bacterium]|nr:ribonuclease HII [candidate division WWE3 bacterium]
MSNLLSYEKELWSRGVDLVAGVDEAGRGPLAGPMVVAAVALNKAHLEGLSLWLERLETVTKANSDEKSRIILNPRNYDVLSEEKLKNYSLINDSKKLTEKRRELLYDFIKKEAISYSIIEISHTHIDTKGISSGVRLGFNSAVKALEKPLKKLNKKLGHVLTDHVKIGKMADNFQTNITKGDSKSINIAAASILAKVYRDRLMKDLSLKFPEYGFERHKGYGTKAHREAIFKFGPCEIHRKSFEPVKSFFKASQFEKTG